MEGLLVEAQAKIARLNNELLAKTENFEQEKQKLEAKFEAEVEKSSNLQKSLKELQDKCLDFGNRCVQRLKRVFNSVGAMSVFWVRPHTRGCPSRCFRSRTVSPTVA